MEKYGENMKKILLLMAILGFSLINCDVTLNIQNGENTPVDLKLFVYNPTFERMFGGGKVIPLNSNESKSVVITTQDLPYDKGITRTFASSKEAKSQPIYLNMADDKTINIKIAKILNVSAE